MPDTHDTFCCLCGAQTPRADVDDDRVFAANILTVCPPCEDREVTRRACACRGHGWLISTSYEYGTIIERCDSCAVFGDDFAATNAARAAVTGNASDTAADVAAESACRAFIDAVLIDAAAKVTP